MRTKILSLAGSAAVGILALTGLQGSAQAYEYRHATRVEHRDRDNDRAYGYRHVTRAEHRDHDNDRFRFRYFWQYNNHNRDRR